MKSNLWREMIFSFVVLAQLQHICEKKYLWNLVL